MRRAGRKVGSIATATYTFEEAFDIGVDNLESLGVLRQLFLDFF